LLLLLPEYEVVKIFQRVEWRKTLDCHESFRLARVAQHSHPSARNRVNIRLELEMRRLDFFLRVDDRLLMLRVEGLSTPKHVFLLQL
jgi:hypothetical protein